MVATPVLRVRGALLFVAVGAGYVLGYKLASNWFSAEDQGASFFPAAGVSLAALVLVPRRQWPIVLAAVATAELALDISNGTSVAASAGYALANTTEPLVGALLLTSIVGLVDLRRRRDLTAFIGCAVIAAPVVGAVIAATTFVLVDGNSGWARFAFEWWSGDGLGVLVVGAALLSLRWARQLPTARVVEGFLLSALAIAATATLFERGWFEFVYVPVVLLVILAFRVGTTGVAVTGALIAFVAAGSTAKAQDFWASVDVSAANRILYLQLALAVILATLLALAAEIAERERIVLELARSETERAAALERAQLAESEQDARRRAQLLESHAAGLAAATTALEVAETTLAGLESVGIEAAWLQLVRRHSLETVHVTGGLDTALGDLRLGPHVPTVPAEVARTGKAVEVSTIAELEARYPGTAEAGGRAPFESLASLPLLSASGRTLGVLTFAWTKPRWLDESRRQLVAGLAEQCGLALERAELRAKAEAAAADAALLAYLGEVLERLTGVRERARALVQALTGDRAAIAVVHSVDDVDAPTVLAESASDPVATEVEGTTLAGLASAAVKADGLARETAGGIELLAVPLRARDRVLGVLTMGGRLEGDPQLTPVLVQRVATRAALAIDNAILYEQERHASHSLQMGLLGEEPTSTPHAAIATAYRPGTAALEVGGDWYDAFTLPNGRLALLVGDVVGHGLEAAVAMGQLRGAVRALAPIGAPREVLMGLDLFVEQLPAAAMATLAYAELDPDTGRLAYACAGHPPPLLVPAVGAPRLLWDGRSTPLGSSFSSDRHEAEERIGPGDTIVLYTDGLVERRTDGISAGLEALLDVARTAAGVSPAALVERVLAAVLEQEEQADDVCLLAVRRVAVETRFAYAFPASPLEVADMRRALAGWLEQIDLAPDRRRDAVLAAAEAAANAAEHAYGFDGRGTVRVEAWLEDRDLRLSIADDGTWRPPRAGSDRGRGRTIMGRLMRDVTIERGDHGTTVRMSMPTTSEARV